MVFKRELDINGTREYKFKRGGRGYHFTSEGNVYQGISIKFISIF